MRIGVLFILGLTLQTTLHALHATHGWYFVAGVLTCSVAEGAERLSDAARGAS